jgi:hypothetical protein
MHQIMLKRLIFSIHICLFAHFYLIGQTQIATTKILASAQKEPLVALQDRKINKLGSLSYSLPWIEAVSIRTETDRFNFGRQKYLIRTSVNGVPEINAQRQIHNNVVLLEQAERLVLLKKALSERYGWLVEDMYLKKATGIKNSLKVVQEDKISVLKKLANINAELDLDYLIKSEDELHQLQQELMQFDDKRTNIHHFFAENLGLKIENLGQQTDFEIDSSTRISVQKMKTIVESLPKVPNGNPLMLRQNAAVSFRKSEYDLEKSKTMQVLDFWEIGYAGGKGEPVRNEFSVGLGINLPFKGSAKINQNDLFIKHLDEAINREYLNTSLVSDLRLQHEQFNMLFRQYQLVAAQLFESQSLYTLNKLAKVQGSTPLALLRLQENLLKRSLQLTDIEHLIFKKYVELLETSGYITNAPLRDYLSEGLKQF